MKLLTRSEVDSLGATFGYKPYTGGTGPSDAQVRQNNIALLKVLDEAEIPCKLERDPTLGDEYPVPCVKVLDVYVGYDRWGFCDTGLNGPELDQADLYTAYLRLYNEYMNNMEGVLS